MHSVILRVAGNAAGRSVCRAGMLPLYLKHRYQGGGGFKRAKCILAIHNLAHQGTMLAHKFATLGISGQAYGDLEWIYTEHGGIKTPVRCNRAPLKIMQAAARADGLGSVCASVGRTGHIVSYNDVSSEPATNV
jgi:hypothetical protein